jgi:ankyrin repeat protein
MHFPHRCRRTVVICALALASGWQTAANADELVGHPLFSAIRQGDLHLVASHLREGVSANVHDEYGTTPLHLAALFGSPEMVALLLDHDANPNAVDKRGGSPLMFAAGDVKKVKLLLDRGADVHLRSALGNTAIVTAASYVDNLDVVKLLLDRGADLHGHNRNNVTPLAAAVYCGDAKAVRFFLDQGCKPKTIHNLFGSAGNSLLVVAAQNGNAEIVDMLLAAGADANQPDANFGGHALNYALLGQNTEVARRLIEAGADINLTSPVGKTPPLVLATYFENGDASIVKLLLERGADAKCATQNGETTLTWAKRRGFPDLLTPLTQAGTPEHPDERPEIPAREVPKDRDARNKFLAESVNKSIALMQHSSDAFMKTRRGCVSCHHQNMQSVALGWARQRGFAVDEACIERIVERQRDTLSRRIDAVYEMDRPVPAPPQLLGYGLWGVSALGEPADRVTEAYVWYLAATQKPDGHWSADAITRPPMGGGPIMSTVLAMRAIQLYPLPGRRDEIHERVSNAAAWLAGMQPETHQDLAYKLMGLAWAGAPPHELQADLTRLRELQRDDGGWAQLPHIASDAWATGQSLVALRLAGRVTSSDPAIERGIIFLLRTQFDDGSWYVQSRAWPFQPPFDSEFPFGRDQWISAGATAWATMALLLEVPQVDSVVPRRREPTSPVVAVNEAAPKLEEKAVPQPSSDAPIDFANDIKPILERSCVGCHSGEKPEGGYLVLDREALIRGGESGEAAVVPGRSGDSPLTKRIAGDDAELAMPPPNKREDFPALSTEEVKRFRAWIDAGADWPDDAVIKPKAY